ncbi:MAG: DUF5010 C-terminal domain-containing protein [Bacteroidales bacterium]|nr:DUF5010 C-terminal domain-containing protein [Bacteroidales bacterium]
MNRFFKFCMISSLIFGLWACGDTKEEPVAVLEIDNAAKSQSFTTAGGDKTVSVKASGAFTVKVEDGKPWCTVSGIKETNFTISVAANTSTETRTAKITVSLAGAPSIEIVVAQSPFVVELSVDPASIDLPSSDAAERAVAVTTNRPSYTAAVQAGVTWLATSINGGTLTVSATENTVTQARSAIITVSADGAADVTVAVTQPAYVATLSVNPTTVNFDSYLGGAKTVTVTTNRPNYTATVQDDATWLTTGMEGDVLTLTAAENNNATSRTATVTVSADGATDVVVTAVQPAGSQPFNGPHILSSTPLTLYFRDFDLGGEGVAFHDTSTEAQNTNYRSNNGDNESNTVMIQANNTWQNIGAAEVGEWLLYTVEVAEAGDYKLIVNQSSYTDNLCFHVELDAQVFPTICTVSTGGWHNYDRPEANVDAGVLTLTEGIHKLKFVIETASINLLYMRFEKQ